MCVFQIHTLRNERICYIQRQKLRQCTRSFSPLFRQSPRQTHRNWDKFLFLFTYPKPYSQEREKEQYFPSPDAPKNNLESYKSRRILWLYPWRLVYVGPQQYFKLPVLILICMVLGWGAKHRQKVRETDQRSFCYSFFTTSFILFNIHIIYSIINKPKG